MHGFEENRAFLFYKKGDLDIVVSQREVAYEYHNSKRLQTAP